MIKTYHNFKQWVKQHYPDVNISPVYGTGAYTLDKALSPEHMYEYNIQQLPNGNYVVWPGLNPEQVMEMYQSLVKNGIPKRPDRGIPTTFTAFEAWLTRNGVKPLHRTHITNMTAAEALHNDSLEHVKRNWYMYEFANIPGLFKDKPRAPYVATENGTVVLLIKTSNSGYVSKRQLFLQKFATMQPLLEQAIAACAKEEWDKAATLLGNYASIQFGKSVTVADINKMKEAYNGGVLTMYVRCTKNFAMESDDTVF